MMPGLSISVQDRLASARAEYEALAGRGLSLDLTRGKPAADADYDDEDCDRDRWPAWREWAAGARSVPSIDVAVSRLRLLGVLDQEPG